MVIVINGNNASDYLEDYGVSHLKATTFEQNFLVLQNNIYLIFFLLKTLFLMNRAKPPEHFHSYLVIIKEKLFKRSEIGHRGGYYQIWWSSLSILVKILCHWFRDSSMWFVLCRTKLLHLHLHFLCFQPQLVCTIQQWLWFSHRQMVCRSMDFSASGTFALSMLKILSQLSWISIPKRTQ